MNNYGKSLSWGELADIYDKSNSGRPARTLRMNTVFGWAERLTDKFFVHPEEGTVHLLNNTQQAKVKIKPCSNRECESWDCYSDEGNNCRIYDIAEHEDCNIYSAPLLPLGV